MIRNHEIQVKIVYDMAGLNRAGAPGFVVPESFLLQGLFHPGLCPQVIYAEFHGRSRRAAAF